MPWFWILDVENLVILVLIMAVIIFVVVSVAVDKLSFSRNKINSSPNPGLSPTDPVLFCVPCRNSFPYINGDSVCGRCGQDALVTSFPQPMTITEEDLEPKTEEDVRSTLDIIKELDEELS